MQPKEVLRKHHKRLVQGLQNVEGVIDHLLSLAVITEPLANIILAKPTKEAKNRELLSLLAKLGNRGYEAFLVALLDTDQHELHGELSHSDACGDAEVVSSEDLSLLNRLLNLGMVSNPSTDMPAGTKHNDQGRSGGLVTKFEPYRVTSEPRGLALIVNNEHFAPLSGVTNRPGSSLDADRLSAFFHAHHLHPTTLHNLSADEMRAAVVRFVRQPAMAQVHCAVLVVMSHGVEGERLIAADGLLVDVSELLSYFAASFCSALADKPKLVILQACRGEHRGLHSSEGATGSGDHLSCSSDELKLVRAPKYEVQGGVEVSDCLIAYSTLPGFVSWRSETEGSWYIQVLLEVLEKHVEDTHLLDLLTQVNRCLVEQAPEKNSRQISQPVSTLTRPFYLSTTHLNQSE